MNTENFRLHGQAASPAELVPLCAGPLWMHFDPSNAMVRRIQYDGREVLRGIYAAVRDRNWETLPGTLRDYRHEIGADSFTIEFESEHRGRDIHFVWRGTIRGDGDGLLRYTFEGEARTTFLRNRIGFCVLHPIRECAGARARQTRTDGTVTECRFPETIEPQIFGQAGFRDLRALSHEVGPGLWAQVGFEGDVFEMEDQRNWTDASYKTYCTPLALPFPVEISAGTRIRQSITLRLTGAAAPTAGTAEQRITESSPPVVITVPAVATSPMPRLGLGVASHDTPLARLEIARLRSLRLSHLRLDLRLSSPDWAADWERALREADSLGTGLELALHLPASGEFDVAEVRRRLRGTSVELARVLALRESEPATTPDTLARVRETVCDLAVPVGAGSDANFCELNREQSLGRAAVAGADFLFWSINPQVHAFDAVSLVETLEAQPHTLMTARAWAGCKPLSISPVTLKPRFNPVATGTPQAMSPDELPPQVDARQLSLFGAAWTLGSLAALAGAGAASATFYETTGWRGVMESATGSHLPRRFPSIPGGVFPVFHVFAALTGFSRMAPVECNASGTLAALCLFDDLGNRRLLLAGLKPKGLVVRVQTGAQTVRIRVLDQTNVAQAMDRPEEFQALPARRLECTDGALTLPLPAHALAIVDLG